MADRISEIRGEYPKGYNSKDRLRNWITYLLAELDKRDQRIADLRRGLKFVQLNGPATLATHARAYLEDDEAAKSKEPSHEG